MNVVQEEDVCLMWINVLLHNSLFCLQAKKSKKKKKVPVAAIKMTLKHFLYRIKGNKQAMSLPERQLASFVFQMNWAITIHLYLIFSILLKSLIYTLVSFNISVE